MTSRTDDRADPGNGEITPKGGWGEGLQGVAAGKRGELTAPLEATEAARWRERFPPRAARRDAQQQSQSGQADLATWQTCSHHSGLLGFYYMGPSMTQALKLKQMVEEGLVPDSF